MGKRKRRVRYLTDIRCSDLDLDGMSNLRIKLSYASNLHQEPERKVLATVERAAYPTTSALVGMNLASNLLSFVNNSG